MAFAHSSSAHKRVALTSSSQHATVAPVLRPVVARTVTAQAMPEWVRSFFDINSWAPKSTRIWRLQQYEYPETKPDEVDELEAKINRLTSSQDEEDRRSVSPGATAAVVSPGGARGAWSSPELDPDGALPATGSFSEAGDSDLAKALSLRVKSLSSASSVDEDDAVLSPEEAAAQQEAAELEVLQAYTPEGVEPLSGQELRELILSKYGKQYDCSFVRRDIPGKTFVCLNIMWQHLEQRSFRLTPEQYEEKTDSCAYLINVLGQTEKVRSILQAPARSEKGLPRRPVVGTAISIQLDLEPEMIKEFFGQGYQ